MQVAFDKMSDVLRSCPHFDCLLALSANTDTYLVGGALRDVLIGRPVTDLDLICPHDPTPMAQNFARRIGGHWFWLDRERLQSRVVVNQDEGCPDYDFALFRAPTLEQDLLDRDFTMNALAMPLTNGLPAASLIDPCRGIDDLRLKTLRMLGHDAFANDPLRIVKGIRHATALDLEIDPETSRSMRTEAAGLTRVASERVRLEVWKILSDKQADRGLKLLLECGAGEQMFGAGFARSHNILIECLRHCRSQWHQLAALHPVVRNWLSLDIEQGLNVETLLLFAFLLASVDRELPARQAKKWKLSRKARLHVAAVSALDAMVLKDFSAIAKSQRAYAWWSSRFQSDPKFLLLALAVHRQAENLFADIVDWVPLVARLDGLRPNDLVDGHWLRNELCLDEGPAMTRALELLRSAEISGEVSTQDQARRFLARHYQNRD